eukprot:2661222-Rhodomonas_salina.4
MISVLPAAEFRHDSVAHTRLLRKRSYAATARCSSIKEACCLGEGIGSRAREGAAREAPLAGYVPAGHTLVRADMVEVVHVLPGVRPHVSVMARVVAVAVRRVGGERVGGPVVPRTRGLEGRPKLRANDPSQIFARKRTSGCVCAHSNIKDAALCENQAPRGS